ncbi:hypothetical protein KAH43_08290, partial [Candidatus Bipolaricaulota bacterium]|nr:hypothetical protein [Candidatus Bipolaricaulota bacterium]
TSTSSSFDAILIHKRLLPKRQSKRFAQKNVPDNDYLSGTPMQGGRAIPELLEDQLQASKWA